MKGPMMSNKCIGIWGRMVGHRFTLRGTDMIVPTGYCIRCGMPEGGWK